ncbi:pfs domain-containing protein [Ilyonectria destructans]|nr:pfs domain-containing protein [Ilyonectria destructans]
MLDELHNEPDAFERNSSDPNAYDWGEIGQHNVVIASLHARIYGTTSAATTASQLLSSLPHFSIGLIVGIGGGIPQPDQDIQLGDIVVGQPDGATGGVVYMPPPVLLNALSKLGANHETEEPMIIGFFQSMIEEKPQ